MKLLNEYSKLTCRLHLMDEFGKPQCSAPKTTFPREAIARDILTTLNFPSIGVMHFPDGGYSFRDMMRKASKA